MTPASVVKVPIALTVLSRIADGRPDGRARVLLRATRRTPGPVGISLMDDDVEMSLRDGRRAPGVNRARRRDGAVVVSRLCARGLLRICLPWA